MSRDRHRFGWSTASISRAFNRVRHVPGSNAIAWKYSRFPGRGEFLYHLDDDPEELRNRAADPACAAKRAELAEALSGRMGPRP